MYGAVKVVVTLVLVHARLLIASLVFKVTIDASCAFIQTYSISNMKY